jgi:MATE family multidrug resistance protein
MIPMGLSQAATVRVGHAVGRRNVEAAYCAGWTATAMTVCFMTMMSVVVMLVPEAFVKLFIDASRPENANVLNLAVSFLFFAAFFQIADGIQEVMSGALLGLNDTVVPMFIAGISYWGIGLATGVWLAFSRDLQGVGLWLGFIFSLSCAANLLGWRFYRFSKNRHLPSIQTPT